MPNDTDTLGRSRRAYFRAAESVSTLSNHRCKIGCVVVRGHRIISSGHNSKDSVHAFQARIDKEYFNCECAGVLHAETDALLPLIKSKIDLNGASIYVFRRMKDGSLGMARPCQRCMKVIRKCGIKYINYTTYDGYASETVREYNVKLK